MNLNARSGESGDEEGKVEFKALMAAAALAKAEQDAFGVHAPDAIKRLATACYGHDNSQALTIAACLASIYNGSEARRVRLDEIRWLDWELQRDLIVVLIGTGHAGFEDVEIRKAFEAIGGQEAVDWFHWYTTGGASRAALERLVQFVKTDSHCSSASTVRNALRSLYNGTTVLNISKLTYLGDELARDMALVLDGIIGADSGAITEKEIQDAFDAAGIGQALMQDEWPAARAKT